MKNTPQKHVIVARVDNKPGVVSRISGLFTRRGYNIESFVTSVTADPAIYQLTISVISTDEELELLTNQLGRIMEVIEVWNAADTPSVTRELMFIKLRCTGEEKTDAIKIADAMHFKIVGMGQETVVIEIAGSGITLENAISAFDRFDTVEIIRSGAVSIDI